MKPIQPAQLYSDGEITESELRHRRVFDKIFKKYDFINSARKVIDREPSGANALITLVGTNLKDHYEGKLCGESNIAMLSLDWSGDLYWTYSYGIHSSRAEAVLECLLDSNSYDKDKCVATIEDSIKLNMWEWARSDDATSVVNVVDILLERDGDSYYTYVMYAEDYGDEEKNIPAWGVRRYELQPSPSWTKKAFRLTLNNYLNPYGGKPVPWVFREDDGFTSVDRGNPKDRWDSSDEQEPIEVGYGSGPGSDRTPTLQAKAG